MEKTYNIYFLKENVKRKISYMVSFKQEAIIKLKKEFNITDEDILEIKIG